MSVHIGEIVLDGVGVADVDAFRAAVMATLTSLAAEHGGAYPSGMAPLLVGATVDGATVDGARPVPTGRAADTDLGARVAHSVWGSIVTPVPARNPGRADAGAR